MEETGAVAGLPQPSQGLDGRHHNKSSKLLFKGVDIPDILKDFLATRFDCEKEACKGFTFYGCLKRQSILPMFSKTLQKSSSCKDIDCEQGQGIDTSFDNVMNQLGWTLEQVQKEFSRRDPKVIDAQHPASVKTREERKKKIEEDEKGEEKVSEKKGKVPRQMCSHPECSKLLRSDSVGGRCRQHRNESDELPSDRPKRKYTRKKGVKQGRPKKRVKADTHKPTSKTSVFEFVARDTAWEEFKESLKVLNEAVVDTLDKAEKVGEVIPVDRIPEYLAEKLKG